MNKFCFYQIFWTKLSRTKNPFGPFSNFIFRVQGKATASEIAARKKSVAKRKGGAGTTIEAGQDRKVIRTEKMKDLTEKAEAGVPVVKEEAE